MDHSIESRRRRVNTSKGLGERKRPLLILSVHRHLLKWINKRCFLLLVAALLPFVHRVKSWERRPCGASPAAPKKEEVKWANENQINQSVVTAFLTAVTFPYRSIIRASDSILSFQWSHTSSLSSSDWIP